MTASESTAGSRSVHLRTSNVSLLLDIPHGGLPSVVHWGAALGDLDAGLAATAALANVGVVGPNAADQPVRLTLPIQHHTAFMGRPGIEGSRSGRGWSPAFATRSVTWQGEPVDGWLQAGAGELVVEAEDDEAQLGLRLEIELAPSGLLRLRATLTNHGDTYALDGMTLALPVPSRAEEILDFAGRWGRERAPQRARFGVGTHLREGRKGRTGADAATVLHAGTAGFGFERGEIWAVHTGWSGNHIHYAECTFDGLRVLGGGELLLPGEVRLARDDTYTTPWIYAAYGEGLDAVARQFHSHLRSRARRVGPDRPVTLNVWEAVYFDHDAARLLQLAEQAAAIGVERFVLDDGWFGSRRDDTKGLGDWVVSPEVWPDGLHPLVNRVRELGMEFGLWFEPEMVNPDSDLARTHPEWVMSARSQWPVEARHQQVLNIGIPECAAHIEGQILAILDEYDIGYIKWDHNRDLVEAGTIPEGGAPGVHAQTAALYGMLASIRRAHPNLEIESCSSGGARVDLGVLEHTDRVWVSDCIDPLERQSMLRWTTQLIPPEFMGSHIASGRSHTTGRTHDLNFRAATAVFGHLGIEWDLAAAPPTEVAELRAWIKFFKAHRHLLLAGDVVRMDEAGDGTWLHGVVAPDRSRGVFAMALLASPLADPGPRIRLRGLDPDTRYRVAPALVGRAPSGLLPPRWWGGDLSPEHAEVDPAHPYTQLEEAVTFPGATFTGRMLASVGVQPPRVHPDQVVILLADAVTGPTAAGAGAEPVHADEDPAEGGKP